MKTILLLLACGLACRSLPLLAAETSAPGKSPAGAELVQQADQKLQQATSRKDFQDAADLLKAAAKLDPENLDIQLQLGWVYLEKLHEPEQAYSRLSKVVKRRPDDVNARKLLAMACTQTGRKDRAVSEYREALRLQPDDAWIKANLGRAYARVGDFDKASALYYEVLQKNPADVDARLGRAELQAWRGHSRDALLLLDQLARENPTNTEVLTLRGDVRRWGWQLKGAKEDYRHVLEADESNYAARTGLWEADLMGASDLSATGYYFKDRTHFVREYAEAGTRLHLADRVYLYGKGDGWRFTFPGTNRVERIDATVGLEVHFSRACELSLEGNAFDYDQRRPFFGGRLLSKISPKPGFDIYTVVSPNQPFISSFSTVARAMRSDLVGNGLDLHLFGNFSFQNNFQIARLSDHNIWWEDKPQLSLRVLAIPATFIRVQYHYLTYNHDKPDYWTPHERHTVGPVLDTSIPLSRYVHIDLSGKAPYVCDESEFGYQLEGGPTIELTKYIQLKGSYVHSKIPGDEGAWSGNALLAMLKIRF